MAETDAQCKSTSSSPPPLCSILRVQREVNDSTAETMKEVCIWERRERQSKAERAGAGLGWSGGWGWSSDVQDVGLRITTICYPMITEP